MAHVASGNMASICDKETVVSTGDDLCVTSDSGSTVVIDGTNTCTKSRCQMTPRKNHATVLETRNIDALFRVFQRDM